MARPYGGKTGDPSLPSTSEAKGAWIAPTEIARQRGLNAWPLVQPGVPNIEAGGYVFALTSGVSDTVIDGGSFYVANGEDKNRTTDSALFEVIGTTYGNGDGSTTFGIPNATNDPHNYLKSTTVSGLALASISGVGVIPHHTHTVNGATGVNSGDPRSGPGNPAHGGRYYSVSVNVDTGYAGSPAGNNGRHRQVRTLIGRESAPCPVGCAFPVLLPLNDVDLLGNLPDSVLVISGQDISRTTYPLLFSHFGTLFGNGDGSTTFGLPDFRGLFLKGLSTSVPQPSGTLPVGYIPDEFASHTHTVTMAGNGGGNALQSGTIKSGPALTTPATPNSSITGPETRGENVSVLWVLVGG